MAVNVRLKHSSIDSREPVAADLLEGELALNINANSPAAYIKDSNGDIVQLAGAGSVTDEASVKKVGDNMTGDLTLGVVGTPVNTIEASGNVTLGEATGAAIALGFATGTTAQTIQIGTASAGPAVTVNSAGQGGGGATQNVMLLDTPLNIGTSALTPEVSITPAGEATFVGDVAVGPNDTNFAIPGHRINLDAANGQIIARSKGGAASFAAFTETGQDEDFPAYAIYNAAGTVVGRWKKDAEFAILDPILGTENVLLSPTGAATFAGTITTSTYDLTDPLGSGVHTTAGGSVIVQRADIGGRVFQGFNGTTELSTIFANGAASFAGDVTTSGGTTASQFNKLFGTYGVQVDSGTATGGYVFQGRENGTETSRIDSSGSASFASGAIVLSSDTTVYAGGFSAGSGSVLIYGTGAAQFNGGIYANAAASSGVIGGNFAGNDTSMTFPCIRARQFAAGGRAYQGMNAAGTETYYVGGSGDAGFAGTVTAVVVPPSDARFKENITPAKPQLADVVALGGLLKNYDWNDQAPLSEEIRAQRQLGLIAQEAAKVCPAIVKDIHKTKQGAVITPEEIIPAVVEPAHTIPAVTKEIPNPRPTKEGETITVEVTPAQEVPEKVITPEQVIPATYEELDDSYKGISQEALIMKLIGAVAELSAEVTALKAAKKARTTK